MCVGGADTHPLCSHERHTGLGLSLSLMQKGSCSSGTGWGYLPEKLEGGIKLGTACVQGWRPSHSGRLPPCASHPLPDHPPTRLPLAASAAVAAAAAAAKTKVEKRTRKHFSWCFFFFLSLFLNQARMSLQQPCWCKINK